MQAFSSHDIFQTLYQQIMLLELKPGSTLRENALCEQFGVSRTPVRSVLQELRIAGLIEVTPYKSTRVTQLDFDTISQQIYLRNAVESAVMTDFAAACTPEQLAQLKPATMLCAAWRPTPTRTRGCFMSWTAACTKAGFLLPAKTSCGS